MRILILGAGGMVGAKLAAQLVEDGHLGGKRIERLDLVDLTQPPVPPGGDGICTAQAVDIASDGAAEMLADLRADVVFLLAAVVSGEAERDFDKGYRVNLDASRALFEAIRARNAAEGYAPRLVFASSIAVYGAPLPEPIPDTYIRAPLTSYGTQKAIVELLLDDYSRRGFFDGIGLRLPTLVIRPGLPNAAASSFFSGILREPLAGERSILPVPEDTKHWMASPRAAVGFLLHAAMLDTARLGTRRSLTMPGLACTVAEQIAALERAAGPEASALIDRVPDDTVARIVGGWPRAFAAERAEALGFQAERSVDELIAVYKAEVEPPEAS